MITCSVNFCAYELVVFSVPMSASIRFSLGEVMENGNVTLNKRHCLVGLHFLRSIPGPFGPI